MGLVALGHVFSNARVFIRHRTSHMGGDGFAEMKDFDRSGCESSLQLLAGELVGNAVVMTVHFDVVINIGANGLPTGDDVAFGGQRLENRPVHFDEQGGASAFSFSKATM